MNGLVMLAQQFIGLMDPMVLLILLLSTLLGLPVSTTHTRTAALLGVGSTGGTPPDWSVARQVALAWLLTFPCCALLGWAAGSVFLGWL